MNRPPERIPAKSRRRGFSLLELCVAIALITFLAGVLLTAMLYYQELAEKTAGELTLLNMRSGVRYQIADKMIHGREAELEQMLSSNPVNWLEQPPPGYVGEVAGEASASLGPGDWFFDTERRELGYVPNLSLHLSFASPAEHSLRWRIRGARSKRGDVQDLSLVSVNAYNWF